MYDGPVGALRQGEISPLARESLERLGSCGPLDRRGTLASPRYIEGLSESDRAGTVRYRTTRKPTEIEQLLAPLLIHFFNHQTHHRGQAHVILRRLTGEAPSFDLLMFQRQTGISLVRGQGGVSAAPERRGATSKR